ncbi:MAG: alanine--glyoxylate aminotransferase family protein [Gemmatimonadota bacterium]
MSLLSEGRFFLPGPTEVHVDVLAAQAQPMIGHRGGAIRTLMERLQTGLKDVFRTERPVIVSSSSATGLMEAAVRNGAQQRVLSLVNGAFSARFAEIAEACGLAVDRFEVPWGAAHDPEAVRARVDGGAYEAVTVVHSETSTGVLNPVQAIAAAIRAASPEALVLVDGVTSVGGAEVRADDWELDFVLTGSQKALAVPPGLAFGVASERMMERSATATRKGVYFDLLEFTKRLETLETPNTPAVSLFYALDRQLERIAAETLEARWQRHQTMRDQTVAWVARLAAEGIGVSVLAPEGYRSPTVTCVALPNGMEGPAVVTGMKQKGWVIGGGYGKLKATTIRIGHMGDHTPEALDRLLEDLSTVLRGMA